MYNRYTPQPDGSFRRNSIAESPLSPQSIPPSSADSSIPSSKPPFAPAQKDAGGFLRQILPTDFDTGDLLIVLLLLLIAGDCAQQRGNALLTLALYLIL